MPEKNLPFFEMFFQYRPAPALAAVLTGWLVTGAVLDSQNRTIEAKLLCPGSRTPPFSGRWNGSWPRSMACPL